MVLLESIILLPIVLILFYKWSTAKYNTLKERGVPHQKPVPLIGNLGLKVLMGKGSFLQSILQRYDYFNGSKVYGTYNMRDPVILIRDIDLVKKIGVKDFDFFSNHQNAFIEDDVDNILSKSLISLKDRKWKEMRNTLTPSFTGAKMRLMFELINECSIEGVKYIDVETKATGTNELDLEMKDYFTKFTNDVIASAAFGIKVNSFTEQNNNFYTIGRQVTQFSGWTMIKAFLYGLMPKVMKTLRVQIFDKKNINFFKRLVIDAMVYRKEHNIIRPDMIHLLMEAKRNFEETRAEAPPQSNDKSEQHAEFNDDDLLAQCLLFFFAGFETVSTCLCFTTWELAMNQDVQASLYEEILETEKELDGKALHYDALTKMKYMDMVISESLRKWPPAIATDRLCSADYQLVDDDGNLVVELKKKDLVMIPIVAFHHDPEHFPDPEKFDPERFSDERKHEIKPFAYLPFGVGPRNCIGNRLALMEVKSIIYHIMLRFKMVPAEKTVKDMMNSLQGFTMQPKEKFWLKLTPREN